MRVWLSGGTGFVGSHVAALLRDEGHEVVALARPTSRTSALEAIGAEVAVGDVTDLGSVVASMRGCDGAFHVAAWYEIGVSDRERMFAINVGGTRNVMEAVRATGVPKLVYCSTAAALGWHRPGELPDETHENPVGLGSLYAESKYQAHREVRRAAAEGLPVVTVMPGAIYGPGDPSMMGTLVEYVLRGWMKASLFDDSGFTFVHVDDVARGLLLAFEKGSVGEEYVLGGEPASVREFIARVSRLAGRRPPRFTIPTAVLKAVASISGPFARAAGFGPRILAEGVATMDGRSWAYTHDKAERELGFVSRSLEEGLPPTIRWFREELAARSRRTS